MIHKNLKIAPNKFFWKVCQWKADMWFNVVLRHTVFIEPLDVEFTTKMRSEGEGGGGRGGGGRGALEGGGSRMYLWFNVVLGHTVFVEPLDIEFTIKMADITNDGILGQFKEHLSCDDV